MGTNNKDEELKYCEWCSKKTTMGKTQQAETPILEFIEDKIDLIGREDIWGVQGDWSMVDIDSDLEAELLIYDEMLNNIGQRIVCTACMIQDDKMWKNYYSQMIGEVNENNDGDPDDDDHYIIELE